MTDPDSDSNSDAHSSMKKSDGDPNPDSSEWNEVQFADLADQDEVVEAIAVDSAVAATITTRFGKDGARQTDWLIGGPPPMPTQFGNLKANGGAATAFALGILALAGAAFTDWSIANAMMGLAFAPWGLGSQLKKLNLVGIAACLIALAICFV